ncbi:MAG: hypothetical protein ACLR1T_17645 [Evtepia gabavorous]
MHEIPALIIDLTIILVIAAGTTLLCKKIHLPRCWGTSWPGFWPGRWWIFCPPSRTGAALRSGRTSG